MYSVEVELLKTRKVRQSNRLIESPYSQEFSAHEIKLFEIAVASCVKQDLEFVKKKNNKEFSYSALQVAKMLNTSVSTISHEMEKTAIRMTKKAIHLRNVLDDGTVEFKSINIMPYAEYRNGIFEFHLNYLIIPYLIEINSHFTEYQLHYLLSMTSASAIKLYKLLYQHKNFKTRSFFIIDLKEQFGLLNKYKQYSDFKKDVLVPSINQINKYTDLTVSYTEIKLGRRIDKIEFSFEVKKALSASINHNEDIKLLKMVNFPINLDDLLLSINSKLSSSTKDLIAKFVVEKGLDYVESSIAYAQKYAKTNFDKYLADTLNNCWAEVEIKNNITKNQKTTEKVKLIKQKQNNKLVAKDQENIAKSENEHAWSKLLDQEKSRYINYADHILKKHNQKLVQFPNIEQNLPLSVYAVTNGKYYNQGLEMYMEQMLGIKLNINAI